MSPILNFFSKNNAIFVEDKYQAVDRINNANPDDLLRHIFIERNIDAHAPSLKTSQLFDPVNYSRRTQDEIDTFKQYVFRRDLTNEDVTLAIWKYR